ncbi:Predicted dehydrogenase [Seinonella peptonophila]|uniref:Predicted dehydrogenase n=1 Tax=Seinonella peptonophila TaxID=112248 RepID=A0A1M4VMA1_9BACL|nr:Gfo/Idh/MocA family oxidoreductase [Seinonella peptonophila]SHE70226.1 Predicted dehydrogenase [Seinonella peptonophila]
MNEIIQVGIIGAGGISTQHLNALQKEPRAHVKAIADISLELAIEQAQNFQIPQIYGDHREMLSREQLDFVIICTPNHLHGPIAIDALKAGMHVLTEKPMTMNLDWALKMKEIADAQNKILMVAQNNRFHAETVHLRRLIDEGRLGTIYHAKAAWIRRNGIPGWGNWFTVKELSGGGSLIDIGVHMLDLAMWLMHFPEPVSVLGKTYNIFGLERKKVAHWAKVNEKGEFNVEDLAIAMIQFADGSSLVVDSSWASHTKEERAYVKLYGKDGGAEFDMLHKKTMIYTDENDLSVDIELRPTPQDERLLAVGNMVDAILGKAEPICKLEESIAVQKILDAIYQSAESGELIKF